MAVRRITTGGKGDLRAVVETVNQLAARIDELIADVETIDTVLDTLVAKLNADTGVTDEDYAAAAAAMTSDGESADTLE